jgi:hypothetical protein
MSKLRLWPVAPTMLVAATLALVAPSATAQPARESVVAPAPSATALLGVEMLLPHLARAQPFARPLAVARALAAGDAELVLLLDSLQAVAPRGVRTARGLATELPAIADAAIVAEAGLEGAGMIGRLAAGTMRLGSNFGGAGTPTLIAVRDALARAGDSDLAGAVAALAALEGAPAAALVPWQDAARERLVVDAAAAALAALVAARVGVAP